ncbi:succinate dehydrogenase/fumarate reductase flavoprotein subunit [Streptomyces sp. KhCrAH-43]|uniref:fumarate reductase/succinate dehydrogenase flavoprotein subunit n=1 Tax=unclassified Streptomyces TaxID=2593676 RepID=UPI00037DC1EA|nr:fumarate reductase/succinate dehydrogenase flavoprotein subunit [Streptomyces sp. KhCrAH-43]MYS38628.1 fumarate reductase/succinate dehydrogenase flavoprotein subunit [Streptomyces sp. SID4920]MYX66820.1 fumarate reductase/succinate dehydrogenase flavoprotein subunit [Streptomyces sp. SID8373]RAJ68315.1 succinate dehydrogenase/fumarate reductase flavoprotein subunit [Streptomyces sp. KhCrAH-43]
MQIPALADAEELSCDVLVVGGGTAGTMAALTAAEHGASVLLLEKAHVRHSGALAMGMDGVNNAVIPGRAEPDDYVAEITRANDGIVDQSTVRQTATRGFDMVRRLESYGVKFEKDEHGEYAVRQVHRSGSYVLPMPEGKDVKKVLYRQLRRREMRERIRIENRVMPVRILTGDDGRAIGAAGFNTRTGQFVTVRAGAVILATGACGRLGLPASGYLYGTYENPTNAGDGYAMAYHAGAELTGIECFQINPLIKDYNGPACAYVANPFGGYQVNRHGERFVDSDYWSGQMMAEFAAEVASDRGPVYLKLSHLPEESVSALETILHSTERPTRGTFHAGRGHDYRTHDIEMHISEIGLCGGHSASGVRVDDHARTTVDRLYAAGDLACVPHNYMIGAFVFGDLAGADAARFTAYEGELPAAQLRDAHELIYRPLRHPDGPPQPQVEYKLRRFVNDYVAPPKSGARLSIALESFERMRTDLAEMGATTPHELMRCAEVSFIRDCAEMAARSSLARTESRWGLYHERTDHPERDDADWFHHLDLYKSASGAMEFTARPVAPYLVPVEGFAPAGGPVRRIGAVEPVGVGTAGARDAAPVSASVRVVAPGSSEAAVSTSPRILELLALNDGEPELAALAPYLDDPDPAVRRAAVAALTESTPPGAGPALATALGDTSPAVRAAVAASLRELVEVLPPSPELRTPLVAALSSADAVVRAAALDTLRALKLGDAELYAGTLGDPDLDVRVETVRALVSVDAVDGLSRAAGDPAREVRVAVAKGLAAVRDPGPAPLAPLLDDPDALVRAAALGALAETDCPEPYAARAVAALTDRAWQVRAGAAKALASADPGHAVGPLAGALDDPNADVRKAAVLALLRHRDAPGAGEALAEAVSDPDADVRAYAGRGVAVKGA